MADVSPPRLCHIKIWPDYEGFGFTVAQAKEDQSGHFITKIEPGSPAEAGGLKENDKLIEINGGNVASFDQKKILGKIKSKKKEVNLLVVDKECIEYYEENNISISGSVSSVLHCSSENVLSLVEKTGRGRQDGMKPLVESMAAVIKQQPRKKKRADILQGNDENGSDKE